MKRRERQLTEGETALWRAVARTVTPLADAPSLDQKAPGPATNTSPLVQAKRALPSKGQPQKGARPESKGPRFGAGDPGMQRRVARGRIDIGGTLDLHGFTQNEARARLERFIGFAAARGEAVVLVVTGKGNLQPDAFSFAASPRGILRQRFLEWIEAPPLRGMITSVRPAHQRHGGRGAFYVFLRRYSS